MPDFPINFLIGLPPEQAIAYLKAKGFQITFNWHEMLDQAHNKSFTVAKAMRLDILQDIKSALETAQQNGETFEQFRRKLEPELRKKGWWGRVPAENIPADNPNSIPVAERSQSHQLGSVNRLRTIYNTNTRSALSAGKYLRFLANVENRPYWQYIAVLDKATRLQHAELDGKVFRWDDPIWATIWPPNDFGCRCDVRALTEAQVKSMGLRIYKGTEIKFMPGKGFRYNPGISSLYLDKAEPAVSEITKKQLTYADYGLPSVNAPDFPQTYFGIPPPLLDAVDTKEDALNLVCKNLGIVDKRTVYIPALNENVIITKELLGHVVEKRGNHRERYSEWIIPTLTDPFEIWSTKYDDGSTRKRFIKLFDAKYNLYVIVMVNPDGGILWNVINKRTHQLDKEREGILLYSAIKKEINK